MALFWKKWNVPIITEEDANKKRYNITSAQEVPCHNKPCTEGN